MRKWSNRFSIRVKLIILVLALLSIPWMGYNYIQEMQRFLLHGQEKALLLTARGITTVLNERPELFSPTTGVPEVLGGKEDIYAHQLENLIQLDGEIGDWESVLKHTKTITGPTPYLCDANYDPDSFSLRTVVAHHAQFLYAMFDIDDDQIVYRDLKRRYLNTSDQVRMLLQLPDGTLKHYVIVARAPGRMSIYLVNKDWLLPLKGEPVQVFTAEMLETTTGYRLELRLPRDVIGTQSRIGFFVVDVDDPKTRKIVNTLSTLPSAQGVVGGKILLHAPELTKILHGLDQPNSRIWILDRQQRVRAVVGGLSNKQNKKNNIEENIANSWCVKFIQWIQTRTDTLLKRPATEFVDISTEITHRPDKIFTTILRGKPQVHSRPSLDRRTEIIVAGYPIKFEGNILGAVIVEQSSHVILSLQYNLLRSLTLLTVLVFAFVITALLIFASRLAIRIHRLRNTTEEAITAEGRVLKTNIPSRGYPKDELGDLGRSISGMLKRLYGYTQYIERMPDMLAHEINNPLNVVSSSLEILRNEIPTTSTNKYMQRARNGIDRMRTILTNLTEAANLEEAMRSEVKEPLNLTELITEFVDGYTISHPGHHFQLQLKQVEDKHMVINGSADHLAEMLDKLIDNAVQFSDLETTIIIQLGRTTHSALIKVLNQGPILPAGVRERLFDPMTSFGKKNAKQSRLGLGLYIVRLVSEFHQGDVYAENRTDVPGVCITISLPLLLNQ